MVKAKTQPEDRPASTTKEFLMFISIPVAIVLLVIAFVVVPSHFAKPKYDFIYGYCPTYDCAGSYYVAGDGVITQSTVTNNGYQQAPELFYFNAKTNSSQQITLADANAFKLDSSNVSPDGYILTQGGDSGGGFLFWGYSNDTNWYLKNGAKKKRVNLVNTNNYYSSTGVNLLGWVNR